MFRPNTQACRVLLRCFSSANLTVSPMHDFLNTVRDLATRGQLPDALKLFYSAEKPYCSKTYATLFHECSRRRSFHRQGFSLHLHMLNHAPSDHFDIFLSNHLVNMYCKHGNLSFAHKLFDEMTERNLVSWTALISGYAQHGQSTKCFGLFAAMVPEFLPNEFAFASVLASCSGEAHARFGTQVHALSMKVIALECSVFASNALVSMYGKTGGVRGVDHAWAVFRAEEYRNIESWNSMISVLQSRGVGSRAVELFSQMRREGFGFDQTTIVSVLSALDVGVCLSLCKQLHCLIVKTGFSSEVKVGTALVKGYSDLGGNADDCYMVFLETSHHHDIVSWTSIITALAERDPERALLLFSQLRREENLNPDLFTFSIVLKACAGLVTEATASTVHSHVIKSGFDGDTVLSNSLIHAYARCGSVSMSEQVFEELKSRDMISWNSMLKAYALHGRAKEALSLFTRISIRPDSTTIVALLSACSHAGLVKEGAEIFNSMEENYGIVPRADHYACLVDMYGRAGQIQEAERLLGRMPMEPDSVIWSSLLGSCRKHGETQLANLAASKLRELEPRSSLGYVQLSNAYCSSGKFDEAGSVWNEMKSYRVRKEPGLSWVELGNQVHEFASGGRRHPEREAICYKLEELIGKLKGIGYVPEVCLSLQDVEEEQKEEQLYRHSEKLALAFCVMNEDSLHSRRSVFKIVKNIRICVDCHKFMKLASDLLQKEIVVRDSNRFHHFKVGVCTCNDYW